MITVLKMCYNLCTCTCRTGIHDCDDPTIFANDAAISKSDMDEK